MGCSKLYGTVLLAGLTVLLYSCRPKSYQTTEKKANLKVNAFILYAHERIEVKLNNQLVLLDANSTDSNKYYYKNHLKVSYEDSNTISLRSFYKDSLVMDTSISFKKEFKKYLLHVSGAYPKKIGLDSLNRMKFPYKLGYVPIQQSARVISLIADTVSYNDVLAPNEPTDR